MSLEDLENGSFEVVALWGAIGSSLKRTVKFSGDEAGAKKEFDKILRGQLKKNYVVVGEKNDGQDASSCGSVTATVQAKQVIARIAPMLCGAIDRATLDTYINEDRGRYVLETKWNGTRKEILKGSNELAITNKHGQPTGKGMLPKTRAEFLKVPFDFTVDCEDEPVGGGIVLLDILTLRGSPLERKTRRERRAILVAFYAEAGFDPKIVKIGEEAVTAAEKRAFFERMQKENAEGVIVKDQEAQYVGASRDYQWKFKFQKTGTFFVTKVGEGGKRNVCIAILNGLSRVNCGKVAIPVNCNLREHNCTFESLQENDTVEVRFLYAEHGTNKLHQPLFLGKRDDVEVRECQLLAQLPASCYKQTVADGD